ncbi:MAG: hypothetical protein ABI977_33005 [Acidobacteriota bacterium]
MFATAAQPAPKFVRRTILNEDEYRVNFKQIDNEVIKSLVSAEAREVTPMMSSIYLSLLSAPQHCWEREGVLHFIGEDCADGHLTAWEQMRKIVGVANSTLSKSLDWMHKTGVIGYDARANGVGIRVFFNRALASIRSKPGQKNLRLVPTPFADVPTPSNGVRFKEYSSEIDLEQLDPRASAREENQSSNQIFAEAASITEPPATSPNLKIVPARPTAVDREIIAALTRQITNDLRPEINAAVKRETDNTKDWFLKFGLPKATRVAQRETYDLLRSHGVIPKKPSNSGEVGRYNANSGQGKEGKSENERIAAFLAETSVAIEQVIASRDVSGKAELLTAVTAVDRQLIEIRDRLISGEPMAIEEIDNSLLAIENELSEALWDATDFDQREAMLKLARLEMQKYALRMEKKTFEDTVRRRVLAQLREQYAIPRIGLFYI